MRLEDLEVPVLRPRPGPAPEDPRLGAALPACLEAARSGARLELRLLADLHRLAVPSSRFRSGPAFAKGGRERYGFDPGTLALLDRRLAAVHAWHPLHAALAAYLDLQFFHPFEDGNARAGRLAFHFHAARGGLSFRLLAPLFTLPLPAGSLRAYRAWARLAVALGGPP